MTRRKVTQVAVAAGDGDNHQRLVALCDDGTVWSLVLNDLRPEAERWEKFVSPAKGRRGRKRHKAFDREEAAIRKAQKAVGARAQ